jgi:Tol biopolymer transport system component
VEPAAKEGATSIHAVSRTLLLLILTLASLSLTGSARADEDQKSKDKPEEKWDTTLARGTTREIAFDTSEGTWMSVDISPDGKWIVFDLLAHIYRMPVTGGNAECLTQKSGVALNAHPRFSLDGKYIAFISDRAGQDNLWVMNADGSNPHAVVEDKDLRMYEPAWTPDSQNILVSRHSVATGLEARPPAGIWLYNRDGGKGIEIVSSKDEKDADWPAVSSDGRYVYFQYAAGESSSYAGHDDPSQGFFQIKRIELRTGDKEDVTSGQGAQQYRLSNGGAFAPEISPDGRWLTFARRIPNGTISYKGHKYGPRTALWLRDLQSGAERVLMDPVESDVDSWSAWRLLPGYGWAHDGKSIVISQGGKIHRVWIADGKVEAIPFTVHVQRTISQMAKSKRRVTDDAFPMHFARWHTASPDGKTLAFQAVGHIWLMDMPSGQPRRLTTPSFTATEYSPAWSPDGKSIVFASWDEKIGGALWKILAEGGSPQQLTNEPGEYIHPAWSPDGATIIVARGSGAFFRGQPWITNTWYDLVSVPASGGETKLVVRTPRYSEFLERNQIVAPTFGTDGRIYYPEFAKSKDPESRRPLAINFVSVKLDGTDRRVHVVFPFADEVTVSPDLNTLAFQEGDNVYTLVFPSAGTAGKPPLIDKTGAVLPLKQVSKEGGNFPHFRDAQTLEFGSDNRYFVYHLDSKKTDTTEIKLAVPREIPSGSLALTNARILTFDRRKVIQRGNIVIKGSRIACVGECSTAGADRVIDVKGKTIIPGLIDMHAHHYSMYTGITPPHDYEIAGNLAYGITTTLDPAAWSQNVFPPAEMVDAGLMIGPRTFSSGDPLYAGNGFRNNDLTSLEVTEENIKRLSSYGVITLKQYLQPKREQHQWVAEIARKYGLNITAEGGGLEYDLGMAMDGQTGSEHPLGYAPLYSDATKFFGMAHFTYSPTAIVGGPGVWNEEYFFQTFDYYKDPKLLRWTPWREILPHARRRMMRPETDYSFPLIAQAVADIRDAGGFGALGGHGQQQGIDSHWELWMYSSALGPMGALEMATNDGAHYLGMDQDLGSITVGKLADLDILNKNPLDDIHNSADIAFVMKGGILYDGTTLDQLWPKNIPFGEDYWIFSPALLNDDRPTNYWDHH